MIIRQERASDFRENENLVREAFWNVYRPGCCEHYLLHRFRCDPAFIEALDLVGEEDGRLVAQIMYCKAEIALDGGGKLPITVFGPISVLPQRQRQGLGSEIIRYSLGAAARLGYGAVAITGNPAYYHRFGFVSGSSVHIYYADAGRDEETAFFMVRELKDGYLAGVSGDYRDPEGYSFDKAELERFDAGFPPKVREKRPGQLGD